MENQTNKNYEQLFLKCRVISIGSYEYIPWKDVMISYSGVSFSVPTLKGWFYNRNVYE